ncbi:MAG TPA: hypothetical protein VF600_04655 [Abditibacteriaceae bacterium]|jgi:hypothetical protein
MYGKHPPIRLANDPTDPVWQWFIYNGPHGEQFTWHSELGFTPRGIEYLAQFIDERTEADAEFPAKARAVALQALDMEDVIMQRTAIQVLCVVGSDEDMKRIQLLLERPHADIVKDARACLFERGFKKRRKA